MSTVGPKITGSAAIHAERIRARDAAREQESGERRVPEGRQTFEVYGERALAGARADEAARRRAEEADRRARAAREAAGAAAVDEDDDGGGEEGEARTVDPRDNPERRSAAAAHRRVVQHEQARAAYEGREFIA